MASPERFDAFELMRRFRSDEGRLGEALALFAERPDYGFIWLAYDDDLAAACISVSLGIDTEVGGVVATLRDAYVLPQRRRRGIGSVLLVTLEARLAHLDIKRIDVFSGDNDDLRRWLEARAYHRAGATFTNAS